MINKRSYIHFFDKVCELENLIIEWFPTIIDMP